MSKNENKTRMIQNERTNKECRKEGVRLRKEGMKGRLEGGRERERERKRMRKRVSERTFNLLKMNLIRNFLPYVPM